MQRGWACTALASKDGTLACRCRLHEKKAVFPEGIPGLLFVRFGGGRAQLGGLSPRACIWMECDQHQRGRWVTPSNLGSLSRFVVQQPKQPQTRDLQPKRPLVYRAGSGSRRSECHPFFKSRPPARGHTQGPFFFAESESAVPSPTQGAATFPRQGLLGRHLTPRQQHQFWVQRVP